MEKILSERGFEPLPSDEDQKSQTPYRGVRCYLESGALDHSAILTCCYLNITNLLSSSFWVFFRYRKELNEEKKRP
jgi:hypothetical protein